ncbi:MAG TPA: beta-ketoacyl synthase N-terminal-like domain-containing protein [Actinocrinis sp.]|nr:beta-ketoacyl synthase N-terminal-like domain-containing protein [Actinocrinis sp.]
MSREAILVSGVGVLTPIGHDVAAFTDALRAARCGIVAVAADDTPSGSRLFAPLGRFDVTAALDAIGLDEETRARALRTARRSPLPVQAALVAAAQAWQDAQLPQRPVPSDRIGLVVGGHNLTAAAASTASGRGPAYVPPRFALQAQDTDHIGTLSQALGITGEGCTVGASSASGNLALIHAARLIGFDAVDVCLAVGAMTQLGSLERGALANLGVLADIDTDLGTDLVEAAPIGGCRPFDKGRSGLVPGEAVACVVLESELSALRRGVPISVELSGFKLALDGNSLSNPSIDGEARAISGALARSRLDAREVGYVNAHGTGTPAGDDAELAALESVFGDAVSVPWVNSTKALIGHTLSAAGAVEAVATVVQMKGGFVHGNPMLDHPVSDRHRFVGAEAQAAEIAHALSNSFGFGGFNTSILFSRC